jgi:hypothetical protein
MLHVRRFTDTYCAYFKHNVRRLSNDGIRPEAKTPRATTIFKLYLSQKFLSPGFIQLLKRKNHISPHLLSSPTRGEEMGEEETILSSPTRGEEMGEEETILSSLPTSTGSPTTKGEEMGEEETILSSLPTSTGSSIPIHIRDLRCGTFGHKGRGNGKGGNYV